MRTETRDPRVFAIDPTSRGFGYCVLEGPACLVDWGVTEGLRADNREACKRVEAIVERYRPDALILEDVTTGKSRRCRRVRNLLDDIQQMAEKRKINVKTVSVESVRRMFSTAAAKNKEEIATTITEHFPELAPWRPPIRKPWMSEDARMAIFDAVAFALTYFYFEEDQKPHAA